MNTRKKALAVAVLIVLIPLMAAALTAGCAPQDEQMTLKVGAQNYAEVITCAYMAQALIEAHTDYKVEVVPRLGSVVVLDQAMQQKEVDIASLLFTGGGSGILHPNLIDEVDFANPQWRDPEFVWNFIKERAPEAQQRVWLDPLGYENTYAVTVSRGMAEAHDLRTVSDLRGLTAEMIIGVDDAYLEREIDGYYPLLEWYDLEPFKQVVSMQVGLLYKALQEGQVDVAVTYSSDARIYAYDLVWLEDDLNFYPPYAACFGVNLDVQERAPEVLEILGQLSGKIDIGTIQRLNYEVDINERDHQEVALEFLREINLLPQ